jgi:hypothetical protein
MRRSMNMRLFRKKPRGLGAPEQPHLISSKLNALFVKRKVCQGGCPASLFPTARLYFAEQPVDYEAT